MPRRRPFTLALPFLAVVACSSPRPPEARVPEPASTPVAVAHVPDAGPADASDAKPADPVRAEAKRRHEALFEQGFNLTHGFRFDPTSTKPVRLELVLPPPNGEHLFSFWADVGAGTLSVRLLGPSGSVVAAWSGHRGELSFALDAAPGKYVLEIDRSPGMSGHALFGVQGPTVPACDAPAGGGVREVAKADAKGFHWPYRLYVPKETHAKRLLVVPNNTGFLTDDLELLRLAASCDIARSASMADRLGVPVLVPLFPRPGSDPNLYLHALSRAALETKTEALARVDLQLLAMIADARSALHAEHVDVGSRVLLEGFSASDSFVSRFALLHPDAVDAVACGSPGGWPIAPAPHLDRETLDYPVGVDDVAALVGAPVDVAAARRVAFFFFMGDKDENDSVPYRDSFSAGDEALVFRRFGTTPVSRWGAAERLYERAGMNARFRLYPGEGHNVSAEMEKDVEAFLGARVAGGSEAARCVAQARASHWGSPPGFRRYVTVGDA